MILAIIVKIILLIGYLTSSLTIDVNKPAKNTFKCYHDICTKNEQFCDRSPREQRCHFCADFSDWCGTGSQPHNCSVFCAQHLSKQACLKCTEDTSWTQCRSQYVSIIVLAVSNVLSPCFLCVLTYILTKRWYEKRGILLSTTTAASKQRLADDNTNGSQNEVDSAANVQSCDRHINTALPEQADGQDTNIRNKQPWKNVSPTEEGSNEERTELVPSAATCSV